MRVVFVASEVVPFAKTGGLADVAGSLPLALEALGAEVSIVMPRYRAVQAKENPARVGKGIDVYFLEHDGYFNRPALYGESGGDYPDNLDRFGWFCRRALELLTERRIHPDVIHCHDWQTGLIPAYLKTVFGTDPNFAGTKTVFTIHNLAYQGLFPREQFGRLGLDGSLFSMEGLEFYGQVNFLKAGLVFSDLITTVSPTYAKEIQTKAFGCGLEGVLQKRRDALVGILNGIDVQALDPRTDRHLAVKLGSDVAAFKQQNKQALAAQCGLESNPALPLFGLISRLADQKGIDLVVEALAWLMQRGQLVVLGSGDEKYQKLLQQTAQKFPGRLSVHIKFDPQLAQRIYAASDFFLMPSRFEPCGLGQMISLRYGTVPVVRQTGGLADTIVDLDQSPQVGNGFVFEECSSQALIGAMERALGWFGQKPQWAGVVQRAARSDFSWARSAEAYLAIYRQWQGSRPAFAQAASAKKGPAPL